MTNVILHYISSITIRVIPFIVWPKSPSSFNICSRGFCYEKGAVHCLNCLKKGHQIDFWQNYLCAILQPLITGLKVTSWGYLDDPVLYSGLLLYSCMQAETRLCSCNYTSMGLQGHSVILRARQCFACCWNFWLQTIYSWLKWRCV